MVSSFHCFFCVFFQTGEVRSVILDVGLVGDHFGPDAFDQSLREVFYLLIFIFFLIIMIKGGHIRLLHAPSNVVCSPSVSLVLAVS